MHSSNNFHRHILLLSGISEGIPIARALISQGWKVTLSVVTYEASIPYKDVPLEVIRIGALEGIEEIKKLLKGTNEHQKAFQWVVDATHPFALLITQNLQKACEELAQPLLRFDRPLIQPSFGELINNPGDLPKRKICDKRVLMAIGSRHLKNLVLSARHSGAEVFARILPSPESLRLALASSLPENHLALLRPFEGDRRGSIERALCERWSIDAVICRQSGGLTQMYWEKICKEENIYLWLISRPKLELDLNVVYSIDELLKIL